LLPEEVGVVSDVMLATDVHVFDVIECQAHCDLLAHLSKYVDL